MTSAVECYCCSRLPSWSGAFWLSRFNGGVSGRLPPPPPPPVDSVVARSCSVLAILLHLLTLSLWLHLVDFIKSGETVVRAIFGSCTEGGHSALAMLHKQPVLMLHCFLNFSSFGGSEQQPCEKQRVIGMCRWWWLQADEEENFGIKDGCAGCGGTGAHDEWEACGSCGSVHYFCA